MVNPKYRAGSLILLFSVSAQLNAAGLINDATDHFIADCPSDAAVIHTPLDTVRCMHSTTVQIRWRERISDTDRLVNCNYTTRARSPVEITLADGMPQPVACWAHRWNSGLQTNY